MTGLPLGQRLVCPLQILTSSDMLTSVTPFDLLETNAMSLAPAAVDQGGRPSARLRTHVGKAQLSPKTRESVNSIVLEAQSDAQCQPGRVTSRDNTRSSTYSCRIISRMAAVPEPSLILSFEDARHLVEDHAAPLRPRGKELVELLEAGRRTSPGRAHIRRPQFSAVPPGHARRLCGAGRRSFASSLPLSK